MAGTNWPLIVLIVGGIGIGGYFLYNRSQKEKMLLLVNQSKAQTWAEGGGTLGGEIHNAIVGGGSAPPDPTVNPFPAAKRVRALLAARRVARAGRKRFPKIKKARSV